MTKKIIKKESTQNHHSRDEYTVVLEDIRSQFKVFGEVLGDVKEIVTEHTARLENVENRLGGVENQLGGVENRLENVENDMGTVKKELSIIRHNQITRDEFKLLKTRVDRLEHITKK
ncbi:MAG: hypothetical protein Athens071416_53 [Parcubacteria group bacterium Athens0714_16]|nr:MAG: hypothetical protein Athens071416_53 [Parcubacteria group bacterium Athens0714_16]